MLVALFPAAPTMPRLRQRHFFTAKTCTMEHKSSLPKAETGPAEANFGLSGIKLIFILILHYNWVTPTMPTPIITKRTHPRITITFLHAPAYVITHSSLRKNEF